MTLKILTKPAIEEKLEGNRASSIFSELLQNTIHFPLANIILELLVEGPAHYLSEPDPYIIIIACIAQAVILGTWKFQGKNHRFFGNLIGPAVYTVGELFFEGLSFFTSPHHLLYWIVSALIGLTQQLNHNKTGKLAEVLTVVEHLIRTSIVLFMYVTFESLEDDAPFLAFFTQDSHIFFSAVVLLLGLVIGITSVMANRYLLLLRKTAANLHTYSKWFLGDTLLSKALDNSDALSLKRRERTVLFVDIRNFTQWSEAHSPEEVAKMLSRYFQNAEQVLSTTSVIKVKYTADEIMAVFPDAETAVATVLKLRGTIRETLDPVGLSAGMGMHHGLLIEGLMGSENIKSYDVIGDTVNTAKRICEYAEGHEVLLSEAVQQEMHGQVSSSMTTSFQVKGKAEPLRVYPLD